MQQEPTPHIPKRPKLAVVVLSYNGRHLLERFLPSIASTLPAYAALYVVDNASADDTSEYIARHWPQARLITLKVNRGFTNGYIESLAQIDAENYVLISNDVEVAPGWIEPVMELLDTRPEVAVVQPKVKWHTEPDKFEYSGAAGGYMDALGYPFCRGRIFFTLEEDLGQYDDIQEVFWCSGACFFVRAGVYHGIGGLDNDYYAHMEDIDLSWRINAAGHKILVCPQSVVYHVGGALITYGSPAKIFRNYKNNLAILVKNMPLGQLLWKFPLRLVLDGVAGLRALLTGNLTETKAIVKAHGAFYAEARKWWRKRKKTAEARKVKKLKTIYPGSIVWQYFASGRKRFSDLRWKPQA